MVLAGHNLLLFNRSQAKGRRTCRTCHPMTSFYVWILFDFLANMVWLIWQVPSAEIPLVLVVFMPATFKVLIGIEQIWLMI